jgi:iron-sulfur cluster assembly protein
MTEKLISITERAADFIKEAVAKEKNCRGIRINMVPGGCGGTTYELTFVNEAGPGDLLSEEEGFTLFIASEAVIFIAGMTVDYISGPMGGNIVFENPNAKSSCKCGKSFRFEGADASCDGCVF